MPYRIVFDVEPKNDLISRAVFFSEFDSLPEAVAIAIEGVDDPAEHDIRVIESKSNRIVWRTCQEDWR